MIFILCAGFCLLGLHGNAQNWMTVMLEQIAKLQVYAQEAETGYKDIQQGLTTIGNIKKGDFDLHSLFFNSLQIVNPAVRSDAKIADIVSMQVQMLNDDKNFLQKFQTSGIFTKTEMNYLTAIYGNILDLCGDDVQELNGVLSDGNWQMTDDQRIERIDKIYQKVLSKYQFIQSFSGQVQISQQQRSSAAGNLQNLKKLIIP